MAEKKVVKEFNVKLVTLRGDDKDLMKVLEALVPDTEEIDNSVYNKLALRGIDHHVQVQVEEVE